MSQEVQLVVLVSGCSPVRDSLESGGPADSRAQWLRPLTTDRQPCGEQLKQKPLRTVNAGVDRKRDTVNTCVNGSKIL